MSNDIKQLAVTGRVKNPNPKPIFAYEAERDPQLEYTKVLHFFY